MKEPIPLTTRYVNFTPVEIDSVIRNAQDQLFVDPDEAFSGSVRQIITEWYQMRKLFQTLPYEERMEFAKIRQNTPLIVAHADVDLEHSGRKVEFNTLEFL